MNARLFSELPFQSTELEPSLALAAALHPISQPTEASTQRRRWCEGQSEGLGLTREIPRFTLESAGNNGEYTGPRAPPMRCQCKNKRLLPSALRPPLLLCSLPRVPPIGHFVHGHTSPGSLIGPPTAPVAPQLRSSMPPTRIRSSPLPGPLFGLGAGRCAPVL